MDIALGILILLIIILAYGWYSGRVIFKKEAYGNYNDLAWAANLPGSCKTCGSDYDPNLGETNLMRKTLENTMIPSKVDYYGLPQGQTYFGSSMNDQLPGKIWNVAKRG